MLLLHSEGGAPLIEAIAGEVPGRVIPMALHHTASAGIDVWLAALSYGVAGITVLMTQAEAPQYAAALETQMRVAQAVLDGLGYAGPHFQLLRVANRAGAGAVALQHAPRGETPAQAATWNLAQDKRNTLDYALEHLFAPCAPAAGSGGAACRRPVRRDRRRTSRPAACAWPASAPARPRP